MGRLKEGVRRLIPRLVSNGVPWPAATAAYGTCGMLEAPLDYMHRRLNRRQHFQGGIPKSVQIPQEKAYKFIQDTTVLPGLASATEYAGNVAEELSRNEIAKNPNNPFYSLLKSPREELKHYPELAGFASSEALIDIAADYFGAVPRLSYFNLWLTQPNMKDTLFNSQMMHLDKPEVSILTLFVALGDIAEENGPFSFISADDSRRICDATNYERSYFDPKGDKSEISGRIADDIIQKFVDEDEVVQVKGPKGTAAFVDTSRCLHYGSRCRSGQRLLMVLRFMPAHRGNFNPAAIPEPLPSASPRQRLALGATG